MTKLIKCLVIPAADSQPLRIEEIGADDLDRYMQILGGYMEVLHLYNPDATLVVNEEGKMRNLPSNERATLLWYVHNPVFIGHDTIRGNAFITGIPDEDGTDTDAPESLQQLLFETRHFAVEVQMVEDGPWKHLNVSLDSWLLAYMYAVDVLRRFSSMAAVRVIPAE